MVNTPPPQGKATFGLSLTEKKSNNQLEDVNLYNVGILIHLVKMETIVHKPMTSCPTCCAIVCSCCACSPRIEKHFKPMVIHDRREINEFDISSNMVLHHLPDLVVDNNKKILQENREGKI